MGATKQIGTLQVEARTNKTISTLADAMREAGFSAIITTDESKPGVVKGTMQLKHIRNGRHLNQPVEFAQVEEHIKAVKQAQKDIRGDILFTDSQGQEFNL